MAIRSIVGIATFDKSRAPSQLAGTLMRVRLPELFTHRGLTAYAVAQQSGGRISTSVLYRLLRTEGRARYLDAELLDALCDVLGVGPGELLEQEAPRAEPTPATVREAAPAKRARGRSAAE